MLFYGSCRRADQPDGLFDLYVLLDGYRTLPLLERWLARLLPPNVYYMEAEVRGERRRAKCTAISVADFVRGTSPRWFHSYLWARFAQPVTLAYTRDEQTRNVVQKALVAAVTTFLTRASALVPDSADAEHLWVTGLVASYHSELRSEGPERAHHIYRANAGYFDAAARLMRVAPVTAAARRRGRTLWAVRRSSGKLLSLLRVLKSAYTFDGGLDYIVWKLERHSGRSIPVPENVRRAPAVYMWGFFWRLYRQGVFR